MNFGLVDFTVSGFTGNAGFDWFVPSDGRCAINSAALWWCCCLQIGVCRCRNHEWSQTWGKYTSDSVFKYKFSGGIKINATV